MNIPKSTVPGPNARPSIANLAPQPQEPVEKKSPGDSVTDIFRKGVGTTSAVLHAPYYTIASLATPRAESWDKGWKAADQGYVTTNGLAGAVIGAALTAIAGGGGVDILMGGIAGGVVSAVATYATVGSVDTTESGFSQTARAKMTAYGREAENEGKRFGVTQAAGFKENFGRAYDRGVFLVDGVSGFTGAIGDALSGFAEEIRK